ncbi:unnamed protein product [Owenia fusiformis]|uniref:Uncharacterized protein n=1 Tax=Owenia fusiformis TaxID=6347 RepID=A0A8J1UN80_OWEFU|nr:unnamed protein product [Owenia fusiformis]
MALYRLLFVILMTFHVVMVTKYCDNPCQCRFQLYDSSWKECDNNVTILPYMVKRMEYNHGNLTVLPKDLCQYFRLRELDVSYNNIHIIMNNSLTCLESLQYLNMAYNNLKILPGEFLKRLNYLEEVNLAYNDIHHIERGAFSKENNNNIIKLNISHNDLVEVDAVFLELIQVLRAQYKEYDFSYNSISKITNIDKKMLTFHEGNYYTFYLRHNNFSSFGIQELSNININNVKDLFTLFNTNGFQDINIMHNPLVCDCNMYETFTVVKNLKIANSGPFIRVERTLKWISDNFKCKFPGSDILHNVTDLSENDFQCKLTEDCHKACECHYIPHESSLYVDCMNKDLHELPQTIPPSSQETSIVLNVSYNHIQTLPKRNYISKIKVLDLSHNDLNVIEITNINNFNQISELLLQHNKLSSLPSKWEYMTVPSLNKFCLHGNPFKCDCSSLWMEEWILQFTDQNSMDSCGNNIVCKDGSPITNQGISKTVCLIDWKLFVGMCCLVVLVTVTAIITLCYFKPVIILLIRKKKSYTVDIGAKNSDAFVCFDMNDFEWVDEHIIKQLEPKFKLCIPERDFMAGDILVDVITENIEQAQRTIMILSRHFLESLDCVNQFKLAHRQYMLHPDQMLIPILMDDFPLNGTLPKFMSCYLQAHTYLEGSDAWFKKKLDLQMPKMSINERANVDKVLQQV